MSFINWPYCFFFFICFFRNIFSNLFFLFILSFDMFISFINWPYCFFFFIKDNRSYLIFLESLLTVSSTSFFFNYFLKLEDILNKTHLFNAVSSIKKSIISSMHSSSFIFKRRKEKRKGKVFFFFFINQ